MMAALSTRWALRAWASLAMLICCLACAPGADGKSTRAFKETRYAKVSRVCPAPRPGDATCFALARVPVASSAADQPGVHPYVAAAGAVESGPAGGLTPADLASAYGFDPTAGGSGQTIAVVDAYNDPNIEGDLGEFDKQYGIAPCTQADGCFREVSQTGGSALPEDDTTGWSVETSLDVEMAHSTCPNCRSCSSRPRVKASRILRARLARRSRLGPQRSRTPMAGPRPASALPWKATTGTPVSSSPRQPVTMATTTGPRPTKACRSANFRSGRACPRRSTP